MRHIGSNNSKIRFVNNRKIPTSLVRSILKSVLIVVTLLTIVIVCRLAATAIIEVMSEYSLLVSIGADVIISLLSGLWVYIITYH